MEQRKEFKDLVDGQGNPIIKATTERKPACFFTVASKSHMRYAIPFLRSLTKFHSPKDIDIILFTDEIDEKVLSGLPKGILIRDLTPYLEDQMFYYRQKPILSEQLLDEYELVVGFDSDQIVLGDLSYLLETYDFDIATVINWNRHDPPIYGFVELARIGIAPVEYFNCGLVALRSKKFAHIWRVNCFSAQFDRMQYKEQDILNVMCYFGNWNVRCLDHPDIVSKTQNRAWWGIIGKAEWNKAERVGDTIIVRKGEGDQPFPPEDTEIKLLHLGGGSGVAKDNWSLYCSQPLLDRILEVVK